MVAESMFLDPDSADDKLLKRLWNICKFHGMMCLCHES